MVPGASSPARAMASPRATTRWIPSSKPRAPLATSAVYSPRLWPAQAAGVRPIRSTASSTTRLSTVVASCAFSVWVSSSIGAWSRRCERSRSAAADASSTTSHDGWSTHGSPIPARCDPCPGKVKTNTCPTAPIDGGWGNSQCCMPAWPRLKSGPAWRRKRTTGAIHGRPDRRVAGYRPETGYDARYDQRRPEPMRAEVKPRSVGQATYDARRPVHGRFRRDHATRADNLRWTVRPCEGRRTTGRGTKGCSGAHRARDVEVDRRSRRVSA